MNEKLRSSVENIALLHRERAALGFYTLYRPDILLSYRDELRVIRTTLTRDRGGFFDVGGALSGLYVSYRYWTRFLVVGARRKRSYAVAYYSTATFQSETVSFVVRRVRRTRFGRPNDR